MSIGPVVKRIAVVASAIFLLGVMLTSAASAQVSADRCVVPPDVRDPILHEISGELALQHVQLLAANRIRPLEEYTDTFFETTYLRDMAERYGLSDVKVDYYPAGEIWVPEEAELWMVEPELKKMSSLTMVPAALASGSGNADVETEVVYVGAGRPEDYAGKNLTGKIALGNASVGRIFTTAVDRFGAVGVLGTGSAGTSGDYPGYTLDQIGWQSARRGEGTGFGFGLSLRQFTELRNYLEAGVHVVMRAHVRTRYVPYRMNVISAAIPGTDPEAGELIHVAHAFERIATPGANDNCTGVATVLEIGRTLASLIEQGELERPRRTIRFLWVPEISGSRAFMYANPELQDRLIAAMNYDMPGEDLELTDSYLRMKMTPDSRPSYLNDLLGSLLRYVDQTDIRTQTGNNAPFNYRLVPFISSSDHIVFLSAGIPAMQFNHWTDNFYHSSGDRVEVSDPTEMKRTAFMGAAGFYYLANAGADEARDLAWEAASNGEAWMAEVGRQSARLLDADGATIHERHKAAQTKITGAFERARGTVRSVLDLSDAPNVQSLLEQLTTSLEAVRDAHSAKLEALYDEQCEVLGVRTQRISLTDQEQTYDRMIPTMKYKFYSDEYTAAAAQVNQFVPADQRTRGLAGTEIAWSIDGSRSILDIYNLIRAEYGNVTTNSTDWKFAYVVTPDTPDIDLEMIAANILAMERAGLVEVARR
jgi:aminopeptidase YwaD